MSTCFGRRPVAIFSSLICAFSSVWRARANSYDSFMGASVLNGVGAGPCETLMPQVIADVIFLHDRGKYQTLVSINRVPLSNRRLPFRVTIR